MFSFPDSSVGKESPCNAGDPGSIPGSGRSTGEGIGYALQYSWASLVAQLVKIPPAVQETWPQPLGWEDPPEDGTATQSSILGESPWTEEPGGLQSISSVTQSCLTLFDPMDYSTSGFPVHHQLPESTQTHPTISSSAVPFSSWPQSFPASGSFQMSQLFASGGQSIGVAEQ